jgi:outer membrane lipoprotein-sorting protein
MALLIVGDISAREKTDIILNGIQKKYSHLSSFRIPYTREVITKSMSMLGNQVKGDTATGDIFFAPPCYLRLDQKTPQAETLVTDGKIIWWHVPEDACAYKYPADKFGKELNLLSDIFNGLTQARKRFKVKMLPSENEKYRLDLRPDPPWEEVDHILLTVTQKNEIQIVEIHNLLGSVTRFNLKKLVLTDKLKDAFFKFVVPDGVRVIKDE